MARSCGQVLDVAPRQCVWYYPVLLDTCLTSLCAVLGLELEPNGWRPLLTRF